MLCKVKVAESQSFQKSSNSRLSIAKASVDGAKDILWCWLAQSRNLLVRIDICLDGVKWVNWSNRWGQLDISRAWNCKFKDKV